MRLGKAPGSDNIPYHALCVDISWWQNAIMQFFRAFSITWPCAVHAETRDSCSPCEVAKCFRSGCGHAPRVQILTCADDVVILSESAADYRRAWMQRMHSAVRGALTSVSGSLGAAVLPAVNFVWASAFCLAPAAVVDSPSTSFCDVVSARRPRAHRGLMHQICPSDLLSKFSKFTSAHQLASD